MASPKQRREELARFLWEQEPFRRDLIRRLAREQLSRIRSLQREHAAAEDVDRYIAAHVTELEHKAREAIRDTCKKVIPDTTWLYLLANISLFSVFLLPAAAVLLKFLFGWDVSRAEAGIGFALLAALLMASAIALLLDAFRKQ